jgi:hypothetical protein
MSISAQVFNHCLEGADVVSHKTQCGVTVITQNSTNLICRVAVVYTFLCQFYITYLTVLILHQVIILVLREFKLASSIFVSFIILPTNFSLTVLTL